MSLHTEYQRLAAISDEALYEYWRTKDSVERAGMMCDEITLIAYRNAKIDYANKLHDTLLARSKWMTKMKEYEEQNP